MPVGGQRDRFLWAVHQDQDRQGFEQTGLVGDVPAHGRDVESKWFLRSLTTQTIQWFHNSVICSDWSDKEVWEKTESGTM